MSSSTFECIEHVVPAQHIRQYFRATANSQEEELQLCVKQYKPRRQAQDGDVTILAASANATPKETYEPLWDAVHDRLRDQGMGIRSIWAMDMAGQGASGLLNKGKLGDDPSILDSARDWLQVVNHFRREIKFPIVGFAHSLGTPIMANLAFLHPRLLHSVVLVEPIMVTTPAHNPLVGLQQVLRRPDTWPSRDAAMAYLEKEVCNGWDARALERFRTFGLREVGSDGAVALTTSPHTEILSIGRGSLPSQHVQVGGKRQLPRHTHPEVDEKTRLPDAPFYSPHFITTALRLPELRPSCFYVYGGASKVVLPQMKENRRIRRETTGVGIGGSGGEAAGRVKVASVDGGSHSVTHQRPDEVGKIIADWWCEELRRWRQEHDDQAKAWDAVPSAQKTKVTDEYRGWSAELAKRDRERFRAAAERKKAKGKL